MQRTKEFEALRRDVVRVNKFVETYPLSHRQKACVRLGKTGSTIGVVSRCGWMGCQAFVLVRADRWRRDVGVRCPKCKTRANASGSIGTDPAGKRKRDEDDSSDEDDASLGSLAEFVDFGSDDGAECARTCRLWSTEECARVKFRKVVCAGDDGTEVQQTRRGPFGDEGVWQTCRPDDADGVCMGEMVETTLFSHRIGEGILDSMSTSAPEVKQQRAVEEDDGVGLNLREREELATSEPTYETGGARVPASETATTKTCVY